MSGAEIKPQKNGRLHYRYCPECNAQYFPRTEEADARLLLKIGKGPLVDAPKDVQEKEPATAPKKRGSSFLELLGG